MTTQRFPQPAIVHALCRALPRLMHGEVSAEKLASAVEDKYPNVPFDVLRICAAKLLRLYFEPIDETDIRRARLNASATADVYRFLADACKAEADFLRNDEPARPH